MGCHCCGAAFYPYCSLPQTGHQCVPNAQFHPCQGRHLLGLTSCCNISSQVTSLIMITWCPLTHIKHRMQTILKLHRILPIWPINMQQPGIKSRALRSGARWSDRCSNMPSWGGWHWPGDTMITAKEWTEENTHTHTPTSAVNSYYSCNGTVWKEDRANLATGQKKYRKGTANPPWNTCRTASGGRTHLSPQWWEGSLTLFFLQHTQLTITGSFKISSCQTNHK